MPAAEEEAENLQGATPVQHREGAPRTWSLLHESCQGMLSTAADKKLMQIAGADGGPHGGIPCSLLRLLLLRALPWDAGVPQGHLR